MPVTPAIECTIRTELTDGFLRLEAIARADAPAAGQYSFLVAKQSESGSSNNAQNGTFVLRAGRDEILTTLVLDRSAVGNYRAELSLQTDSGGVTCTSP
jgi:hypothetical protein